MSARYRPEIDGLRAIAILAVVAYHVGVPGARGGFVGVDVFFVISGFLITSLLLEEHRRLGTIDLLGFYARRARRLLPAFVLVVLATLLLGVVFLLPVKDEQSSLASSAVHAAIYTSNHFFARHTGGYFDGPSDLMPLLHTWSPLRRRAVLSRLATAAHHAGPHCGADARGLLAPCLRGTAGDPVDVAGLELEGRAE